MPKHPLDDSDHDRQGPSMASESEERNSDSFQEVESGEDNDIHWQSTPDEGSVERDSDDSEDVRAIVGLAQRIQRERTVTSSPLARKSKGSAPSSLTPKHIARREASPSEPVENVRRAEKSTKTKGKKTYGRRKAKKDSPAQGDAEAEGDKEEHARGKEKENKGKQKMKEKKSVGNKKKQKPVSHNESGDSSGSESGHHYEVQKIVAHKEKRVKGNKTKMYYLVKWKGYPAEDNTWEPEENVSDTASKIVQAYWEAFKEEHLEKRKPGSSRETAPAAKAHRARHTESSGDEYHSEDEQSMRAEEHPVTKKKKHSQNGTLDPRASPSECWEDQIREIRTVQQRGTPRRLEAEVIFLSGKRKWYPTEELYARAPQKMLRFYESKIQF